MTTTREKGSLFDKDVEFVFTLLRDYFDKIVKGKDVPEPTSTIAKREILIDAIWEAILVREELGADEAQLGHFRHGSVTVTKLEQLYVICFNRLINSCRLWRKEFGVKGYIKFIQGQFDSMG